MRGQRLAPAALYPRGKTRYPLYRRLVGLQDRSGQVRKISPPTGIRSSDYPPRSQSLYRLRYPAHDWTMHGDNFAFAFNNSVSSVKFSTPLFVALATERKSEDVMPARHGGGRSDGTECNTGAASTASA